jgi:6-phosphogluconolactonase
MHVEVVDDARRAAAYAADLIERAVQAAVSARGQAAVALSGGAGPGPMFDALAAAPLPWSAVHVFQVDERVAPAGDPDRNATAQAAALAATELPAEHLHLLPVEAADLDDAAVRYEAELASVCDGVLDCVHLGMGPDGHTASLFPGDALLDERERLVAATAGEHLGRRRMTLTLPAFDRARSIVWLVTGSDKGAALRGVLAGDPALPAGRVPSDRSVVVCDRAAYGG